MSAAFDFHVLTGGDLGEIHKGSLRMLEEIGVRFPNAHVLGLFEKNGALVDWRTSVIRIPGEMVESSIRKQVENNEKYYQGSRYSRVPHDLIKGWMSLGNLRNIVDYSQATSRPGCLKDVLQAIAIANALSYIERVSGFVEPADIDKGIIDIAFYFLLCTFSAKRFFLSPLRSLGSARCVIKMAEVMAEDEIELRDGRLIECELEAVRNLEFSPESLEIACEFSRRKLKTLVGHYCLMGRDSTMDYLSATTVANANILAALTAVMLMNPDHFGMDYVFAAHGMKSPTEPRHLFGAPHQVFFALASRQLADHYGFRNCISNAGLSDSCGNDFQSGFERGVTATVSFLCGNTQLGLQGLVGADQAVSLDELIMDDAMLSYLNHVFLAKQPVGERPINVNDIIQAGVGASLADRVTERECQGSMFWRPPAFSSDTLATWQLHQKKGESRLQNLKEEMLARHYPPALAIPVSTVGRLVEAVLQHTSHREAFIEFLRKLQTEIPGHGFVP